MTHYVPTTTELVATLVRDLGREGALRFAERLARMDGPLTGQYTAAAERLRAQQLIRESEQDGR